MKAKFKYNHKECTCSEYVFYARIHNELKDILDEDFDWTNVFFAGGLPSLLMQVHSNIKALKKSDIDLFLYGGVLTVTKKIKYVYDYLMKKFNNKIYVFMYNDTSVFTFLIPGHRPVQLIANLNRISNGGNN